MFFSKRTTFGNLRLGVLFAFALGYGNQGLAGSCGPGCGGGGTVVQPTDGAPWGLVDNYTIDENFQFPSGLPSAHLLKPTKGIPNVSRYSRDQEPAFEKALQIVDRWKDSSPILVAALKQAISGMPLLQTNSVFGPVQGFSLPSKLQGRPTLTAILYVTRLASPIISLPVWNQLSVDTKAGLIIHEALRQLQHIYFHAGQSSENELFLPEDFLQWVTGTLLKRGPNPREKLEADPRFSQELRKKYPLIQQVLKARERYYQYSKSMCALFGDGRWAQLQKYLDSNHIQEEISCPNSNFGFSNEELLDIVADHWPLVQDYCGKTSNPFGILDTDGGLFCSSLKGNMPFLYTLSFIGDYRRNFMISLYCCALNRSPKRVPSPMRDRCLTAIKDLPREAMQSLDIKAAIDGMLMDDTDRQNSESSLENIDQVLREELPKIGIGN